MKEEKFFLRSLRLEKPLSICFQVISGKGGFGYGERTCG
jgi:hypothetical protein